MLAWSDLFCCLWSVVFRWFPPLHNFFLIFFPFFMSLFNPFLKHFFTLSSLIKSTHFIAPVAKDNWEFVCYRSDGRVHIFGEWAARTKSQRYIVIGPDWACVAMTYIVIIVPSTFVSIYLLVNLAEKIIYFILFGLCIFGLTTVFIADPGLVRKYHHARSRHWTYW